MHARFLLPDKKHSIVAVCDADRSRAVAFAQRFGIANTYANAAELLDRERPDVVHVLTPPQSHASLALQAIRAGCHVLVEKPMALSVQEADAMIEAAGARGVKLCVNHNQLFEPVLLEAQRRLAEGRLGTVIAVESYYGFNLAQAGERRWVETLPGNMLQNLAPHPISVMLPFVGDPVELQVAALATGALGPHVPDELRVVLTGRRILGVLSMSFAVKPHLNFLRIYTSKAVLHVDLGNMILSIERLRSLPKALARGLMSVDQGAQLAIGAVGNAFRLLSGRLKPYHGLGTLIHAFYESLEHGGNPPVTGEAGRSVVRIFEDIRRKVYTPLERPRQQRPPKPQRETVFVTGASGFLGSHLAKTLVQHGLAVRALVRPTSRIGHLRSLDVEWVEGSLGDAEALKRLMSGCGAVYHCAAATNGTWSDYLEGTVRGTERLLEASLATGVRRFVHVSSLSVYGVGQLRDGALVTEETPYEPYPELRGGYSRSKVEAEKLVLAYGREQELPIVILRPGTVYGPRGKVFFPRIGYSVKNKVFLILGRGDHRLPLTYVENVAEAVFLAGTQENAVGQIYNIIDDDAITGREYVDQLMQRAALNGFKIQIPFGAAYLAACIRDAHAVLANRPGQPPTARYRLMCATKPVAYDNSRAKNHLRWRPAVSLDEGLRRTFDWYTREHDRVWPLEGVPVAAALDSSSIT